MSDNERATFYYAVFDDIDHTIIRSICNGHTNADICKAVQMSDGGVRRRVAKLLTKFKATTRAELIYKLFQKKILRFN